MSAHHYYNYYVQQARGLNIQVGGSIDNFNVYYRGVRFQRPLTGRGWFSNLVSRVLPVLKTIGKSAGKSVLKGALDVGQDLLAGRPLSEALKDRAQERSREIASSALETVREQIGSGPVFNLSGIRKRKRANSIVNVSKRSKLKQAEEKKLYAQFLKEIKLTHATKKKKPSAVKTNAKAAAVTRGRRKTPKKGTESKKKKNEKKPTTSGAKKAQKKKKQIRFEGLTDD